MLKGFKRLLALSLTLVMVLACINIIPVSAATTQFMQITSGSGTLGDVVSVTVSVSNVLSVAGMQCYIHYDKNAMILSDADLDDDLQPDGVTAGTGFAYLFTPIIHNDQGSVFLGGARASNGSAYTTAVPKGVATLNFTILPGAENRDYSLTFDNVEYTDVNSNPILPLGTHQVGTITVHDMPAPGPVDPVITTWPTVKDITYGKTFDDALNNDGVAAAANPGSFTIKDAGTIPDAGTYSAVEVTFTPNDQTNFNVLKKSDYTVNVSKIDPVVTWPTPDAVTYSPTLTLANVTLPAGFAWAEPTTSLSVPGGYYRVQYTPANTTNYNTLTKDDVAVTVNKADQAAPSLSVANKTETSITIAQVSNAVYSLKDAAGTTVIADYSANNEFTGLTSNTTYKAYIKLPETANYNESAVNSADVTTNASDDDDIGGDLGDLNPGVLTPGDPNSIVDSITLPGAGTHGSTITWSSNNPRVISNNGRVIRPANIDGDQQVILTATAEKNGKEDSKPITVTVKALPAPPVMTFGKFNAQKPTISMKGVSDVAVDSLGNIYIADYDNSRIVKFGPTGALLKAYGSLGGGEGQFNKPDSVSIGSDDTVYVADTYNNRIVSFKDLDENGILSGATEWKTWGGLAAGTGPFQFTKPTGLFVKDTKVYVADAYNNRIAIFDTVSNSWNTFGSKGKADDQFVYPWDVVVDSTGDIWVADLSNNAVKRLSSDGTFIIKYTVAMPYCLAVDSEDNVYASQRMGGSIVCANNRTENPYGGKGTLDSQFISPLGLTVDQSGSMWVVDVTTNKIQQAEMQ